MRRTLVIGASGQTGSELTKALRKKYGNNSIIAADFKSAPGANAGLIQTQNTILIN